eukprot:scaffold119266_cov69-Phaeocystis_antarctica.AAC.2
MECWGSPVPFATTLRLGPGSPYRYLYRKVCVREACVRLVGCVSPVGCRSLAADDRLADGDHAKLLQLPGLVFRPLPGLLRLLLGLGLLGRLDRGLLGREASEALCLVARVGRPLAPRNGRPLVRRAGRRVVRLRLGGGRGLRLLAHRALLGRGRRVVRGGLGIGARLRDDEPETAEHLLQEAAGMDLRLLLRCRLCRCIDRIGLCLVSCRLCRCIAAALTLALQLVLALALQLALASPSRLEHLLLSQEAQGGVLRPGSQPPRLGTVSRPA